MRHSKVTASVAENASDAEVAVVEPDGADVIEVLGGVVSAAAVIVQVAVAGEVSTLPAVSVARTSTCACRARGRVGLRRAARAPGAAVDPALERAGLGRREAQRRDVAVVEPDGADVIDVSGGVVSTGAVTVHDAVAGVASMLPARSIARTSKLCAPTARPLYDAGEEHVAQAPPSMRHWNVDAASVAVNVMLALVDVVEPEGADVSEVSGAVVSMPPPPPTWSAPASQAPARASPS